MVEVQLFGMIPAVDGLEDHFIVPPRDALPGKILEHRLKIVSLNQQVYGSVRSGLEDRFRFQEAYVVLAHLTEDGQHHVYTANCSSPAEREQVLQILGKRYGRKDYIWGKSIGNGALRP